MAVLRAVREQRGLSREDLEELTGIDATQISRIESGAANVTFRNLHRVASALGLRIALLPDVEAEKGST